VKKTYILVKKNLFFGEKFQKNLYFGEKIPMSLINYLEKFAFAFVLKN
jgi:hypothetical protein